MVATAGPASTPKNAERSLKGKTLVWLAEKDLEVEVGVQT
jgi:hypothetical protein